MPTEFAQRFKELRGPLGQLDVCYLLGVTPGTIQKWERGKTQPGLENLIKIATETGAPMEYIAGVSDDWDGTPAWWSSNDGDGNGRGARRRRAPGPDSPTADLDAAVKQRPRGDERRRGRGRPHQP